MLIQQLIFTVISFALFVFTFYRMIKTNDTTYVAFIVLQAIGIAINFIEVFLSININAIFKIVMYTFSIIIPLILIILENSRYSILQTMSLLKAKIYFNIGKNKKAKNILINLVDKHPQSYKGHKLLAQIYEEEGGQRKAIEEYVQAIEIEKKDYDSYFKVATLLNGLDKRKEAREMLTNLLNIQPEYKEASILLGDLLMKDEMYKEALSIYYDALKFEPLDYDLNYCLGITYTMMNDFKSAKQYYEKAANINTYMYSCKYALAEIALIYKELEEAENKFLVALQDEELAPDSYYELAKLNLIKGNIQRAIQYANLAVDLKPKKISEKIKNEPIFIPIMARIAIPFNLEENKREKSKFSHKEKIAKEHLEEMAEITKNIGYNDIQMFSKSEIKPTYQEQQEEIKEDDEPQQEESKEIQE